MSETQFYGFIVCDWIIDHPYLTIGQAIEELNFNDQELEFALQWYDTTIRTTERSERLN